MHEAASIVYLSASHYHAEFAYQIMLLNKYIIRTVVALCNFEIRQTLQYSSYCGTNHLSRQRQN
jgi:hypothetical protein